MIRKANQIVIKPTSRSGIAQPASTPSSQLRNGLRQRAGELSDRAAIPANAKSTGTKTHIIQQVNGHGKTLRSCSCATGRWRHPSLQNFAGDRIDVNLLRMFGILNQNFPYSPPVRLLQSGVERAAAIGFLG